MLSLLKWSLTSLLVISLYPASVTAEQVKQAGDYAIHYNTLNTDILNPDVAREYGIQRSKSRAMLNVSVINKNSNKAVPAKVTVTKGMLTGHKEELDIREIREGEAIYYISDFPVAHRDTLQFNLQVRPKDSRQSHTIEFEKQFFTE